MAMNQIWLAKEGPAGKGHGRRGFAWIGASLLAVALAASLAGDPRALAQAPEAGPELEWVGEFGGPSWAVAMGQGHAYLGLGSKLEVLDIATPDMPRKVGQYQVSGTVLAVALGGDTGYVAGSASLHVVDLSDPTTPKLLGLLDGHPDAGGEVWDLALQGRYLYASGSIGLAVIDVEDPARPVWLSVLPEVGQVNDLAVAGEYMVTGGDDGAIRVFGLADPTAPEELSSLVPIEEGYISGVALEGRKAYASAWAYDEWFLASLGLRDLAGSRRAGHPLTASRRASHPLTGSGRNGRSLGGAPDAPILTVASFLSLDLADPTQPTFAAYDLTRQVEFPGKVEVAGDHVAMLAYYYGGPWSTYGNYDSVLFFDVAGGSGPALAGQSDTSDDVGSELATGDGLMLVADDNGGMRTFDIADPTASQLLGHYDTPYVPRAVAADGARVMIGDSGIDGVWSVNARDPNQAYAEGNSGGHHLCWADCDVALGGGYGLVADYNQGILVFDLTDPHAPTETARFDEASGAVAIDRSGRYAYAVTQPDGVTRPLALVTVDLSEAIPKVVSHYKLPWVPGDVAYSRGHVLVSSSGGLSVIDVGDPGNPRLVGSLGIGGRYWHIAASRDKAYLVEANGTFHVIDVGNPREPREIGWLDKARQDDIRPNSVMGLEVSGGIAYVLHEKWVQAIDVTEPASPRELTWRPTKGDALDFDLDQELLYIVGRGSGLQIGRLSRPGLGSPIYLPSVHLGLGN